jgi:hypothetical protein
MMAKSLKERSWGLCILDEVHSGGCAPFYRLACEAVGALHRLGLSATLVREDGKIKELQESVGRLLFKTKSSTKAACAPTADTTLTASGGGSASAIGGAAYPAVVARQRSSESSLKITLRRAGAGGSAEEQQSEQGYGDGYRDSADGGKNEKDDDTVPGVSVRELQHQGFLPRMTYMHVVSGLSAL